tara:strand:- start:97 stop:993 length:897 start_codon:yes stop_codon:yes gene_type:complete
MGLKLSRKIRSLRNKILKFLNHFNPKFYKLLILIGSIFKFYLKINQKKKNIKFSKNLDEINIYEFKKTSQNNEDGLIEHIFKKLNVENLNFVEIGFDYYENNSLNLLRRSNNGLFIDGSEEKTYILDNLLKIFFPKKNIKVLNFIVTKDNINSIISNNLNLGYDKIDFMSIDVDGNDYYLFESLNYRPKVLCIEYNFWYGEEVHCSIPYNKDFSWEKGSVYFGSSLLALFNLALKKDYHLVATDSACVNAFFVRGDLKKDFKILDPKINFKVPLRYSKDEINSAKKYLLSQNLKYFKE